MYIGEIQIFFKKFENSQMDCISGLGKYDIRCLFNYACRYKTLNIVKFFCDKLITQEHLIYYQDTYSVAFTHACDGNNLDVMTYLYDNYVINPNIFSGKYFILLKPCKFGYIDTIRFITEKFPDLNYRPHRKKLIDYCCNRGYYDLLYYLKSKYNNFDNGIRHERHPIASHDEAFIEWFRAGCPIRTNMKSAKK